MDSESIINNSTKEENSERNVDNFFNDHTHPKVTAKKTFFDLHRDRRNENDETLHPRIRWSAGTTEIGSRHETTTYNDEPIVRSSISDSTSTLSASKNDLPSVSNAWGEIDVQPTQPEEIQHLLEPCPIINKSEIVREVAKPKKKFFNQFRKSSKSTISDSEETRISDDDEIETTKPEEEFRLLNKRYINDGIIPMESFSKNENFASVLPLGGSKSRFKNLISDPNRQENNEKDDKVSLQPSFRDKQIVIDKNATECPNIEEPESNDSPLPARRSCEPLDIKNLRKFRESDPRPGTSGIGQHVNRKIDYSEITDMEFASRISKISIDDPRNDEDDTEFPNVESGESLRERIEETVEKIDSFATENPFSDFSLQTVKQRGDDSSRQRNLESTINKVAEYQDSALPGTSKVPYKMDRLKVSYNEIIENPDEKKRNESFSRSPVSDMKKSSFLDDPSMINNPQRLIHETARKIIFTNVLDEWTEHREFDEIFGRNFLTTVVRRIVNENVSLSNILLKTYDKVDFSGERMLFHSCCENFESIPMPLMKNLINPTFDNLPTSNLPYFAEPSSEFMPVVTNNMWNYIIHFFNVAFPKAITDVPNVSQISKRNIDCADNKEVTDVFRYFATLSKEPNDVRESVVSPLVLNSSEIINRVANIALSQDPIHQILFLSFGQMSILTPNTHNFECSYSCTKCYSKHENYRPFPLSVVDFLEKFSNFCATFYLIKPKYFERRDGASDIVLSLVEKVTRSPRFTSI